MIYKVHGNLQKKMFVLCLYLLVNYLILSVQAFKNFLYLTKRNKKQNNEGFSEEFTAVYYLPRRSNIAKKHVLY